MHAAVPAALAVRAQFALLQVDIDIDLDPGLGLVGGAVSAFLTTLIVGAILVAVAPEYTTDRMAAVVEDPVAAFLYGLAVFLLLILVVVVLVFTFVGIVVAVPLAVLGYVAWAVGSTVAFLAIVDRIVGREEGWTRPLVVAAALNGGLALTGVGGLVTFAVGAAGFGVVLEPYL
jgi:hypothetical protein